MRLIDADALKEKLSSLTMTITGFRGGKSFLHECMMEYRKFVLQFVDEAPTIEAEPVRHGRWEEFKDEIYCSLCECTALMGTYGGIIKSTYCPHCAAKMDGGKADGR